jgi:hypothetical protein
MGMEAPPKLQPKSDAKFLRATRLIVGKGAFFIFNCRYRFRYPIGHKLLPRRMPPRAALSQNR